VVRDEHGNEVQTDRGLLGVSLHTIVNYVVRRAANRGLGDLGFGDERVHGREA